MYIHRSSAPHEVYVDELARPRIGLAATIPQHIDAAKGCIRASNGGIYPIHLLLTGALQRSIHLVDGFLATWDRWNIDAAAPLVRLQIDSLVRTAYASVVEHSDKLVMEVLKTGSFRKMKDESGHRLTDRYLVDSVASVYPWLSDVYEASNEWVHFSPRHVFNTWSAKEPDVLSMQIPLDVGRIPVSFLEELVGAMYQATTDLLGLLAEWTEVLSQNPEQGNEP